MRKRMWINLSTVVIAFILATGCVNTDSPLDRFTPDIVPQIPLILFSGRTVNPESEASLKKLTTHLKDYPKRAVVLIGNADSDGVEEVRNQIAWDRAEVVELYLYKAGIPVSQIKKKIGNIIGNPQIPDSRSVRVQINRGLF